jgi:hypothetical protein
MWIDDRGSEVLSLGECRRLLAVGAKRGLHGHLGIAKDGAPLILPVDFTVDGSDVVVRVGDHIFGQIDGALVSIQVDNAGSDRPGESEGRWSVLVRGFAGGRLEPAIAAALPHPRVAEPGQHLVRIRGDVVTGRRLRLPATPGTAPA